MKLGEDVLVEIMDILQTGLLKQVDISDLLRKLDLKTDAEKLVLSDEYKKANGRVS